MTPPLGFDPLLQGIDKGYETDSVIATTNPLYMALLTEEYSRILNNINSDPILSKTVRSNSTHYSDYLQDSYLDRLSLDIKFAAFPIHDTKELELKEIASEFTEGLSPISEETRFLYLITNVGKFVVLTGKTLNNRQIRDKLFWANHKEFEPTEYSTFPQKMIYSEYGGGTTVFLEVNPEDKKRISELSYLAYLGLIEKEFGELGDLEHNGHPARLLIDPKEEAERIFCVNWK